MKLTGILSLAFAAALIFSACKKEKDTEEPGTDDNKLKIGQEYQGGILVYLDNTGEHGFVASKVNVDTVQWGCYQSLQAGTFGTAIGTGQANTTLIVNGCSESGTAAKVCDAYSAGGYSDWYLPSRDELMEIYKSQSHLSGVGDYAYWSSSQSDADKAYGKSFDNANIGTLDKDYEFIVRAIRSF